MAENNGDNNNININIIDIINNRNLGNDENDNIYRPHNYINYIINFNSNSKPQSSRPTGASIAMAAAAKAVNYEKEEIFNYNF